MCPGYIGCSTNKLGVTEHRLLNHDKSGQKTTDNQVGSFLIIFFRENGK